MRNYVFIFICFALILFFALADLAAYVQTIGAHSKAPFYVCLTITIPALLLTILALRQSHIHRNDKEEW
jgi:hypothetical protein